MSECERKGKWFGGCKFEPRYDYGIADLSQFKTIDKMDRGSLQAFRPKKYVRDVCVTCGKAVARPVTSEDE